MSNVYFVPLKWAEKSAWDLSHGVRSIGIAYMTPIERRKYLAPWPTLQERRVA